MVRAVNFRRNKKECEDFKKIPKDVVFYHILPWVQQFKFREQTIPRMLIDYTRIEKPDFLIEYNQFDDFKAASNIPQLLQKMKCYCEERNNHKFYSLVKGYEEASDLDRLPLFMLMILESKNTSLVGDIKSKHDEDLIKDKLQNEEWNLCYFYEYALVLRDQEFSERLFEDLLIDHKFLLEMK